MPKRAILSAVWGRRGREILALVCTGLEGRDVCFLYFFTSWSRSQTSLKLRTPTSHLLPLQDSEGRSQPLLSETLPGESPGLRASQTKSQAPGWPLLFLPSWGAPGVAGRPPFPQSSCGSGQVGDSSTGSMGQQEAVFLEACVWLPDPRHWRVPDHAPGSPNPRRLKLPALPPALINLASGGGDGVLLFTHPHFPADLGFHRGSPSGQVEMCSALHTCMCPRTFLAAFLLSSPPQSLATSLCSWMTPERAWDLKLTT